MVELIEDKSLRATAEGYQVQLRLNWYRSLPVSCVERVRLKLDGQLVDPEVIRFGVNGHQYRLQELKDQVEEFWFVQDSVELSVHQPDQVKTGESHKLEMELALRFPYIPIGPGKFLTRINKYAQTQVAG